LNDSFYWSSFGVEILEESNSTHTVCLANHLTDFAGGWVVLPPKIDFAYVWENASFYSKSNYLRNCDRLGIILYSSCIALHLF